MEIIVGGATVITVIVGVIGFFLKRTITTLDRLEDKINNNIVTKPDYKHDIAEIRDDIKKIRDDYTPRELHEKDFDECVRDIKTIKDNFLTREDFFRSETKTDRKLDMIMNTLLEYKGEKRNG